MAEWPRYAFISDGEYSAGTYLDDEDSNDADFENSDLDEQ